MFLFLEQRKKGNIANKKNLTETLKLNVSKVKARDSVRVRDITSHQYEKVSWEEKYLKADISQFQLTQISLSSIYKKKKKFAFVRSNGTRLSTRDISKQKKQRKKIFAES